MTEIKVGGRQSGRTTQALLAAPKGAVYVWVNHRLEYPKALAHKLGRDDLKIVSPKWIEDRRWVGMEFPAMDIDHETHFTERQWELYWEAKTRVRPVQPSAGTK
jgi:hypothetical protein